MAGPISTGLKSGPTPTLWDCDFEGLVGPADEFIGIDSEDRSKFNFENFLFFKKIQICLTTLTESGLGRLPIELGPGASELGSMSFKLWDKQFINSHSHHANWMTWWDTLMYLHWKAMVQTTWMFILSYIWFLHYRPCVGDEPSLFHICIINVQWLQYCNKIVTDSYSHIIGGNGPESRRAWPSCRTSYSGLGQRYGPVARKLGQ